MPMAKAPPPTTTTARIANAQIHDRIVSAPRLPGAQRQISRPIFTPRTAPQTAGKVRPPGSHGAAWIFSCLGKAAHWPVPGSTHTGGKGRIGPAPVEPHDLMGSEFNLRCCKAFCELLFSEGSDQGKGRKGLAQHVGQRDLGRRPSFAFRKPFRPVEASPVFGKVVDAPQAAGVIAMARESTGKEAARLRRPGKK